MKTKPVYCISGSDDFRVDAKARDIIKQILPEGSDSLGLETIEGRCDNAEQGVNVLRQTQAALATMSLFGGQKVVWLKDADLFRDSKVGRTKDVKEQVGVLKDLLTSGFPEDHTLLISSPKLDKRSAFYKACDKIGECSEFAAPEKSWQADEYAEENISAAAKSFGLEVNHAARRLLIQKVGADSRSMFNELEKLSVYKGDEKTVSPEDVDQIISTSREAGVFDFAEAAGKRDVAKALTILRQLSFQGESLVALMIMLARHFNMLLLIRDSLQAKWLTIDPKKKYNNVRWLDSDKVERRFGECLELDPRRLHSFRVSKMAEQAQRLSRKDILFCQEIINKAHQDMVSSSLDPLLIMELLLFKMCSSAGAKPV